MTLGRIICGDKDKGVPSLPIVVIRMFTFHFIAERCDANRRAVRQSKIDSETAVGLLSALMLGVSSALFFSATTAWSVGCGFISSTMLVGAVSCSVLQILILAQLNETEATVFADKLGSHNRMTGQIFMAGSIFWLLGFILYMFDTLTWQGACVVIGVFVLLGFIPFYVIPHALIAYYETKHHTSTGGYEGALNETLIHGKGSAV
jgi:hypothetical protein